MGEDLNNKDGLLDFNDINKGYFADNIDKKEDEKNGFIPIPDFEKDPVKYDAEPSSFNPDEVNQGLSAPAFHVIHGTQQGKMAMTIDGAGIIEPEITPDRFVPIGSNSDIVPPQTLDNSAIESIKNPEVDWTDSAPRLTGYEAQNKTVENVEKENSIETQPTAFEKEYIEKLHELIKLDSELRSVLGYFGKDNIKDVLSDDTTRRILASAALYENPIPKDNALGEPDNNVMRVA